MKNLIYVILCLSSAVIIGAGTYEHLAVWPHMYAAPPQSLSMIQGEYGLSSENFWANIHPVTLVLFLVVTAVTWKTERRKHVWIAFGTYVAIIIATFLYFVPELQSICSTPFSDTVDASLQSRGSLWINLSLLRLFLLILAAIVLNLGLTKDGEKRGG